MLSSWHLPNSVQRTFPENNNGKYTIYLSVGTLVSNVRRRSSHLLAHTYQQSDIVGDPCLSKPVAWINQGIITMWNRRNFCSIHTEGLTPPSFNILDMISMYSIMLWAVSIKKQVTTTSQTPAMYHNISIDY